ncbi:MAG: hypothetical protein M3Y08_01100 [Fibrobacterota bacterium]|nr:hypothetical protein [Fibrobacterota bacterium]
MIPKMLPTLFFACLSLAVFPARAGDGKLDLKPMSGFASYEMGRIEEGTFGTGTRVDNEFLHRASVWFTQEAELTANMRILMGLGGIYYFVYPRQISNPYAFSKRSALGLSQAQGIYTFGDPAAEDHTLRVHVGIMPMKYNPDAKNLGEYLFRTWSYPGLIATGGFDIAGNAGAQVSGLRLNTKLAGFKNDFLVTTQTDHPPIYDFSVTDIMSYDVMGVFEIGAGIMLENFISMDEDATSPKVTANEYYTQADGKSYAFGDSKYVPQAGEDTSFYTYAGTKVMGRAALNPQGFLKWDRLGPQDLKLYAEVSVLGWKNYPGYYEKRSERMPVMVGFNLPTFKLLDVFSVEYERYKNRFPLNSETAIFKGGAVPSISNWFSPTETNFHEDDVKWTVYAEKRIVDGFRIVGQVGRDHLVTLDEFSKWEWTEIMQKPKDWYYIVKLNFTY